VSAPRSSDPPASGLAGDGAVQPATELDGPGVTGRRRAAALAGHLGDAGGAHAALGDDAPAVRATGLGALDRLGVLSGSDLAAALADPAPVVRRRACELAARFPEVDLSAALADPDPSVVEMAAWAAGERQDVSVVAVLAAMAAPGSGHRDPLCREAAVAALGAIGEQAGLAAVLAALEDKPAIRRRAAVALAAFTGPAVDRALHRCLEDRDWQVRQVAEDLLAGE